MINLKQNRGVIMELFFIRHGQSEANLQGIIQGHAEYPLSSLGKKQASLVGQYLSSLKIHKLYSSDLSRAVQTAEAIADHHNLTVEQWSKIKEIGLGPFEGMTRIGITEKFPDLPHQSILTSGVKGTESIEAITKRCESVWKHLVTNHKKETVILVSHGGFISIFLMYLMAKRQWASFERPFIIGNTSITKVEIDDTEMVKFHYINKTTHLEEKEESLTSTVLY